MTGDGECPHCRAPEPIAGTMQHAFDCPHENPAYRGREPLSKEALMAIARAAEQAWYALRERAKASAA